ncbi:MAG: SDR family oxidoreductase [Pirellulaceae bacterium]
MPPNHLYLDRPTLIEPIYLLTGASGLVGRYLLAGLLQRGCQVAALIRSSPRGSAAQRCEEALGSFERSLLLPRPRVIESNLHSPKLGISPVDLQWLRSRPVCVIHCAASIRFVRDPSSEEPYRTNVDGTQQLLAVCRELQVVHFHHVSTAYVGSRAATPRIMEAPVDQESLAGNDYELSKIRAECLVRQCSWLPGWTIHRPSIVVGDSQSSFSSTFHGFYAPLQIGAQYAKAFGFSPQAGDWFRQHLGIAEHDSKNLVPVDWVAESIVRVAVAEPRPNLERGRILHWTNPRPVACSTMQAAIVDSIEDKFSNRIVRVDEYNAANRRTDLPHADAFRQQMEVYESYFGNDPVFDTAQANLADTAPCPVVDYALLRRLADFAINNNFGWPRPPLPPVPAADIVETLRNIEWNAHPADAIADCSLSVQATGPGAPERLYFVRRQVSGQSCRWFGANAHLPADVQLDTLVPLSVLAACITGKTEPIAAIDNGYWAIQGTQRHQWLAILTDWVNDRNHRHRV